MGLDFSSLVLRPGQAVFGEPVTVIPLASQPGQPAYAARGIFRRQNQNVVGEDGVVLSTADVILGIRLSEFPVEPVSNDQIAVRGRNWLVFDVNEDGQGGADLVLKGIE